MTSHQSRRASGFALPLVLWLIVILMTMVGVLAYSAKVGHIESRAQFDRVEAEAAAQAGITYAVARMTPQLDAEAWGPSFESRNLQLDDWSITLTIRDESGKFDLNHGPLELLAALMQARQVPASQAALVTAKLTEQRRDAAGFVNPIPAVPGAPPAAGPTGRKIASISELRQWQGIEPATIDLLADELTVHSSAARPEWRLASPSMRKALADTGQAGVDTRPASGAELGSGTYAIESIAQRSGRPPGRVFVVLRAFPRGGGGMASTWLAWEHGRWTQ